MNKSLLLLPALGLLLVSCSATSATGNLVIATGSFPSWTMDCTANYYYNLKKSAFETDSYSGKTNALLYWQDHISAPAKLTAPSKNPERTGYTFTGWYTSEDCLSLWDFANETAQTSVFLYAGWTLTGEGDYTEPTYTPKIEIDDTLTTNLALTGVLNIAPVYGVCNLTAGGVARLNAKPSDVAFALNYKMKTGTSIKSAVYESSTGLISVASLNGTNEETDTITAKLTSADLRLSDSTYEAKAQAYETAGASSENYHIMLAGSSSIEFWTSYAQQLDPIVAYNHGIGGTTAPQWDSLLLDRLVVPYCPKGIVYYVGVNDIVNSGNDSATVITNVEKLLDDTHAKLPNTHVFYVYVNLLPGYYLGFTDTIKAVNAGLATYIEGKSWIEGVDAGKALLKSTGAADAGYFRLDNLHLSEYGYVVWSSVIKKALKAWLG